MEKLYDDVAVELVDGGVHDNQGIASLLDQDCTVALVSDASGQMRDLEHPERGLLAVANRSNSILMSRVRGAEYTELAGLRRSGTLRGLMIVHLKKGLPSPPRDWSRCQEPYDPEDDALAPGVGVRRPPYGIDEQVQRALSELRTDLDSFTDDEAYALMAAGYAMTRFELSQALPDPPPADPELEALASWPFAPMLARLDQPDAESGLLQALQPGRARFFRRLCRLAPAPCAAAEGVARPASRPHRDLGGPAPGGARGRARRRLAAAQNRQRADRTRWRAGDEAVADRNAKRAAAKRVNARRWAGPTSTVVDARSGRARPVA